MGIQGEIESEFIKKLQSGDEMAFAQLYEEFRDDILFYIAKLVKDKEFASGLVSESFTKYWVRRENFPSLANIRAFLYTTSRNLASDWLKRKDNRFFISESSLFAGMPEGVVQPSVDNEILKADVYNLLYNALEKLGPDQRKVVKELFLEEKSIKEICMELRISPELARQNKSRGLKKLRDQLGNLPGHMRNLNWSPILLLF